jgi:hypothetical protein
VVARFPKSGGVVKTTSRAQKVRERTICPIDDGSGAPAGDPDIVAWPLRRGGSTYQATGTRASIRAA